MKFTNLLKAPKPLVRALTGSSWCPKEERVGVTQLTGPPLVKYLIIKHWDELEEDCMDRFFSMFGSAVHTVLEKSGLPNIVQCQTCMHMFQWNQYNRKFRCAECSAEGMSNLKCVQGYYTEAKLEVPLEKFGYPNHLLVGKMDMFDPISKTLVDWKCTSVWSLMFEHDDWEQQLNVYDWMLKQHGHEAENLFIYVLMRDWKKTECSRSRDYPDAPFKRVTVKRWSTEKQEEFIRERLDELVVDGVPRACTPAERWRKPTTHKLHKKGVGKAVRVLPTVSELEKYAADKGYKIGGQYYIKSYQGQDQRCESYCSAAAFCPCKEK